MDRGDIYHVDLNPIQGREQAGRRYVMVVSSQDFNRLGTPLVCPITQGGDYARSRGFAASLSGVGTNAQSVVLCNQPRVLDLQNRRATFAETAPRAIVDEVIAKLLTILD